MVWGWSILFLTSLYILVKSAQYFTSAAEKIGRAFHMPNFIVGSVLVAIGTSAPEAFTSLFGTISGQDTFLAGNIIGTVFANTLLGLGIAVLLTKRIVKFDWDLISNDLPLLFAAVLFLGIAFLDRQFTFAESFIMFGGYIVYILYSYTMQRSHTVKFQTEQQEKFSFRLGFTFCASLAVLIFSSKYVVESLIALADVVGIESSLLAASVLAVGSSLPEISIAITAARRGNFDLALGDIVGSNIFDIFVVFGIGGLFGTLAISHDLFFFGLPLLIGSTVLLWLVLIDKQFTKTEAALFLLTYGLFIGKLFHII